MKTFSLLFLLFSLPLLSSEFKHMQDACDNNIPSACYEFGVLYENGIGLQEDKVKAKAYYLKACDYGFEEGCTAFKALEAKLS